MKYSKPGVVALILFVIMVSGVIWGIVMVKNYLAEREAKRQQIINQKKEEVTVTILEGWTIDDITEYLDKKGLATKTEFAKALDSASRSKYPFLQSVPKKASLEGFLFPDTYRFFTDATAEDILDALLENFGKKIITASNRDFSSNDLYIVPGYEALILENAQNPGLTLRQLITLASIIEKESSQGGGQEERKIIAGIFYNRLNIGQALQSDATLNYITKSGRAQASQEDLEIDSPYNTYKNQGLPPGPIGNPSLSSIMAALEPTKTDYYYFLHSQTTGRAHYARTFEEHVQNRAKYLK